MTMTRARAMRASRKTLLRMIAARRRQGYRPIDLLEFISIHFKSKSSSARRLAREAAAFYLAVHWTVGIQNNAGMVGEILTFVCLPPYFAARVELATQLEAMYEAKNATGLNGTDVLSLISTAKWNEHNATANEAMGQLTTAMIEADLLAIDQLKGMARDAMLAKKPVNPLIQ